MEVKVKYLRDVEKIKRISNGDWIDLRSAVDVELKTGEYKAIPLGFAMQLPDGYEANIVSRSSTLKNFGVLCANAYAVIDNSYCGDNDEWKFVAYAVRDTVIHKNDRICQFRINKKQPEFDVMEVDTLGNPDRGGIGSTGVK